MVKYALVTQLVRDPRHLPRRILKQQSVDYGTVEPFPNLEELSPQERRCVALFALDYSTKEIARELAIAPDTVKTYARRIYAKLGVKSKAGCVAVAFSRLMDA